MLDGIITATALACNATLIRADSVFINLHNLKFKLVKV